MKFGGNLLCPLEIGCITAPLRSILLHSYGQLSVGQLFIAGNNQNRRFGRRRAGLAGRP
jgi:hypothetical protein